MIRYEHDAVCNADRNGPIGIGMCGCIQRRDRRIAELEQALRLNLGVAPDDPILLTPVEREIVELRAAVRNVREAEHAARLEGARAAVAQMAVCLEAYEPEWAESVKDRYATDIVARQEKGEK